MTHHNSDKLASEELADNCVFFAHTREGEPLSKWQPLLDHLLGVAKLSSEFSEAFGSEMWGFLAGLLHDLGKYNPEFQEYLRACSSVTTEGGTRGPEHSGVGAALAQRIIGDHKCQSAPHPLAMVIAGHHAGLSDSDQDSTLRPTPAKKRLPSAQALLTKIEQHLPLLITEQKEPAHPFQFAGQKCNSQKDQNLLKLRRELWTRFLFSALIDADRLDTERFCDEERYFSRASNLSSIAELQCKLDTYIDQKVANLSEAEYLSEVNQKRQSILARCRGAAILSPGLFSLTVPTGGGKTLAAMSFALKHAKTNHKRRIIVVIPYTSIIEQNAQQYRNALGGDNVLEHHSTLDEAKRVRDLGEATATRQELAAENWDSPVVVTTTVQFFETLFANRTAKARKLHNIAKTVIILDEVQTLPPDLLLAILDVLKQLVDSYGCSIVLSTATPPALSKRHALPQGLTDLTHIIENPQELAGALGRVRYEGFDTIDLPRSYEEIADEVSDLDQALVVVNLRADARELAKLIISKAQKNSTPVYHLSALMCPRHRLAVIKQVRRRLRSGSRCILVSTQLIEAGVDLDFPVVFRALAGLDSIVQAAGRCNREGKLGPFGGRVIVYRPTTKPPGQLRRAIEQTEALIATKKAAGEVLDPSDPQTCETYFRMFYHSIPLDGKHVQQSRLALNFATTAKRFQMIEQIQVNLIAPFGPHPRGRVFQLLEELRKSGPDAKVFRALQPYTVSIYKSDLDKLRQNGCLAEQIRYWVGKEERVLENTYYLHDGARKAYDSEYGLLVKYEPGSDPETYID